MQPPTLIGRWPLSDAARVSNSLLRTIVGHWLLPTSKTLIGWGGTDGSFAEAEPINVLANNNVTVHATDFSALIIVLFFPRLDCSQHQVPLPEPLYISMTRSAEQGTRTPTGEAPPCVGSHQQ